MVTSLAVLKCKNGTSSNTGKLGRIKATGRAQGVLEDRENAAIRKFWCPIRFSLWRI